MPEMAPGQAWGWADAVLLNTKDELLSLRARKIKRQVKAKLASAQPQA